MSFPRPPHPFNTGQHPKNLADVGSEICRSFQQTTPARGQWQAPPVLVNAAGSQHMNRVQHHATYAPNTPQTARPALSSGSWPHHVSKSVPLAALIPKTHYKQGSSSQGRMTAPRRVAAAPTPLPGPDRATSSEAILTAMDGSLLDWNEWLHPPLFYDEGDMRYLVKGDDVCPIARRATDWQGQETWVDLQTGKERSMEIPLSGKPITDSTGAFLGFVNGGNKQ